MLRFLFDGFGPRFDWLQVEVTTACTAACVYCPRTVHREIWQDRFLSLETFDRLQPALPRARHVHLQGWGEPLLHPNFFQFARQAKAAGCQVGATTNGMLLDEPRLVCLVELELDVLAFSLAGADSSQDKVRRGTRFAAVISAIETLQRLKAARASAKPAVHVAYMWLRSRLADLSRLPRALAGLGVDQVVISTLDYVAAPELEGEVLRPQREGEFAELTARLKAVGREAENLGITLHHHLHPRQGPGRRCSENPTRALVVAADGSVKPCVFWGLPMTVSGGGTGGAAEPQDFGHLDQADLLEIWAAPGYREFRQAHARGLPPALCRGCPKLI